MSRQADNSYICDSCGQDVGNGGIGTSMSLVDYHDGQQRHRHLCYSRTNAQGQPAQGCRDTLLGGLA